MAGCYRDGMRTQALRVTVGAYSDGAWHVSVIRDIYERGVLVNSQLELGPLHCDAQQLRWKVRGAVDHLMALEEERLEAEQGRTPGPGAPLLASAQ